MAILVGVSLYFQPGAGAVYNVELISFINKSHSPEVMVQRSDLILVGKVRQMEMDSGSEPKHSTTSKLTVCSRELSIRKSSAIDAYARSIKYGPIYLKAEAPMAGEGETYLLFDHRGWERLRLPAGTVPVGHRRRSS